MWLYCLIVWSYRSSSAKWRLTCSEWCRHWKGKKIEMKSITCRILLRERRLWVQIYFSHYYFIDVNTIWIITKYEISYLLIVCSESEQYIYNLIWKNAIIIVLRHANKFIFENIEQSLKHFQLIIICYSQIWFVFFLITN